MLTLYRISKIFQRLFHLFCIILQFTFIKDGLVKQNIAEKNLIIRLKDGDERAFQHVYDLHYVLLCRFAEQMLGDIALAEEIVDDSIFYLWEHREDIEITVSLRAYLIKAVRNRCLNELKSSHNREKTRLSLLSLPENIDFLDTIFVEETNPLGYLLEHELEEKLLRYIEELPPECRNVFKMSRFEEKTYEEIATEQHISINTVKYHIKNALSILQEKLGDYLKLLIIYIFMGN